MDTTRYRPDIDGLRALAVVSVVLYHVGLPGFGGGFVGVDVFFVISGFVITTLLVGELRQTGSIDLAGFYARRVRRLLPAFLLVVVATLVLGSIFLVPVHEEQQGLANSAISAILYASNAYFARHTGGYFDEPTHLVPLLHTWSLAVEGQFYLIWPLILLVCAWLARRVRWPLVAVALVLLAVAFVVSLGYGWLETQGSERAARSAFFSLRSRLWELAAGSMLAILLPAVALGVRSRQLLALAGLGAIGAAVALYSEAIPYPGLAALLPTLGAAALIAAGAGAQAPGIVRVLSSPPLVAIGLVSYSWYLWHWPLLAIARASALGVTDLFRDGAIALVALGLAVGTYYLVERPTRRIRLGAWPAQARVLAAGAAASLLVVAGAVSLRTYADWLATTDQNLAVALADSDRGWSRDRCLHRDDVPFKTLIDVDDCLVDAPANAKFVVLWGDSHADHFVAMLQEAGRVQRLAVLPRAMSGCPPVRDVDIWDGDRRRDNCDQFNAAVLTEVKDLASEGRLAAVVLSAHWSHYLGGTALSGEAVYHVLAKPGTPADPATAPSALSHGLAAMLGDLADANIKAVVFGPSPEQRYDAPRCLARQSVKFCSIEAAVADSQRSVALNAITAALATAPHLAYWDPLALLCERRCLVKRDGTVVYRDDNHLTYSGSRQLAQDFEKSQAWRLVSGPTVR